MKANLIIARNVRRLRVLRNISQEALAVDADIDRTYVSRIERGLENPSVGIVEQIAKALKTDIRELFDPAPVARGAVKPLPGGRRKA